VEAMARHSGLSFYRSNEAVARADKALNLEKFDVKAEVTPKNIFSRNL